MNHLTATSSEGAQISTLPVRAIDDGAKNSIGKQGAASMTNGRSATDVKENHRQRMDETKSPILADHVYHDDDDDDGPATAAEQLNVTIVSARYAPCEGKRLLTGEWVEGHNPIPYTRDVTPFLRALLIAQKRREETKDSSVTATAVCNSDDGSCHVDHNNIDNDDTDDPRWVRLNALSGGQRRAQIRVLDPSFSMGMNGIFGDPIPGTSKRLHVHYIISETTTQTQLPPDSCGSASKRPRRLVQVANTAEAHTMSFAEHERVYLRRRWTVYRDQTDKLQDAAVRTATKSVNLHTVANEADLSTLRVARKMGRSQSISEFADVAVQQRTAEPPSVQWRLRSATSEVALPLVMVFLGVRDRVQCRLVCTVWRNIIREWGVATTIDDNDPTFPHFTRPFLRGILSHSYSSLQSLFLSGTSDIEPQDLHPAIPHLRNLRSLDISRCIHLDNSTMQLLAQHVSGTLEVLYMKGLRKVTDDGLISIARTCQSLKVIDISNIPVTDQAAIEVGAHLTQLRAIYMRDNYLLTNTSVDVITEKCILLEQLTLWGCTRLKHLSFDQHIDKTSIFTSGSLILLNLWGCHNLGDDTAHALQGMNQLRTLIVSECHRLTDSFVYIPLLNHLHLRYCKRITDHGVNAIALSLQDLYSLDLSFCTNVTISALMKLLEIRGRSLAELRLQSCTLDIARDPNGPPVARGQYDGGYAGRQILAALRSHDGECCLSVLDVRLCTGQPSLTTAYSDADPFVRGIAALDFEQKVPGFFARPARWNQDVECRLVKQILSTRTVPL